MEYWKQVKDYPHLLVSRTGKVWTTTYNRELGQFLTNRGYLVVKLCKDKTVRTIHVHRIVAEAFIPNPDNLPTVDHIDGNKLNNNVENLQWLSYKDNTRKAGELKKRAAKSVFCQETNKVYKSIHQAGKELNIKDAIISAIANGEFSHYHGLHFEYYKR